MKYIICYKVPGLSFFHISDGIFGSDRKKGFYAWSGGGCIGGPFRTIGATKAHIVNYAKSYLKIRKEELEKELKLIRKSLLECEEDKYYSEWIENYRDQSFKEKEKK